MLPKSKKINAKQKYSVIYTLLSNSENLCDSLTIFSIGKGVFWRSEKQ